MALADPQTVTINAVPNTLNRVSTEGKKSIYSNSDGTVKLTVSHQESKDRTRRMIRLDKKVIAADPLTAENEFKTLGIYIVIDEPLYGFDDTAIDQACAGLVAWAGSANVLKVLSSQH